MTALNETIAEECAREVAQRMRCFIVKKGDVPFIGLVRSAFDAARALGANVPSGDDFDRTSHGLGPALILAEASSPAEFLETVAHEAEHGGQFWRGEFRDKVPHGDRALEGGLAFVWLYLVEPIARIRFEARAHRAGFEVRRALGGALPTANQCVDSLFRFYALPDALRSFALPLFESTLTSVQRGVVTTDAGAWMIEALTKRGVLS
jgi:hypothetical protein